MVVLPPGRVVFSPGEQTVPVLATGHSPPCVGEPPGRTRGPMPWKRPLLAFLLRVHPKAYPNYAPAQRKAVLLG